MSDPDETLDQPVEDSGLSDEFEQCATCGAALPDEWCPIVTETDAEGELVIRSFCDEACKNTWIDR